MTKRKHFQLKLPSRTLCLGHRTLIMGVLNVTPDSFSDGGKFLDPRRAVEQALAMGSAGADLLDIVGESTPPRFPRIPPEEELPRPLPIFNAFQGLLHI